MVPLPSIRKVFPTMTELNEMSILPEFQVAKLLSVAQGNIK